jgi:hypothetical protein
MENFHTPLRHTLWKSVPQETLPQGWLTVFLPGAKLTSKAVYLPSSLLQYRLVDFERFLLLQMWTHVWLY